MTRQATVVCAALALAGSAGADLIEFTFEGVIDTVGGSVPAEVEVGDAFRFIYTFDTLAMDTDDAPNFGLYVGAAKLPSLVAGNWTAPALADGDIGVLDNGFAGDSYSATVQTPVIFASIGLTDFDGGVFVSDDLPADLDLAAWEIRHFAVEVLVGPAYWNAGGTITDFSSRIIPAPGAAAVTVALCAAIRRRRAP